MVASAFVKGGTMVTALDVRIPECLIAPRDIIAIELAAVIR